MASTLLISWTLVQLVTLAVCITHAADKTKDTTLDTDLDAEETGWLFQGKGRELEYLKNKLLSPFSNSKSPSFSSSGGGYSYISGGYPSYSTGVSFNPSYSTGVSYKPSYSYGGSYPAYSSGWSSSNSLKPGYSTGFSYKPSYSYGGSYPAYSSGWSSSNSFNPSYSYGGSYPTYSSGWSSSNSINPSYSYGVSYPAYSSGWSGSNSFKPSYSYGGSYPIYSPGWSNSFKPSYSYGGSYPAYSSSWSSSNSFKPSYSYGGSYPSYPSGWSSSDSFKKSPINYLTSWFKKGDYGQHKYNYAPGCVHPSSSNPTSTHLPSNPTYSYGTPLQYYYYSNPTVTYGTPNIGSSATSSFNSELGGQSQFEPSSYPPSSIYFKSSFGSNPFDSYKPSKPIWPSITTSPSFPQVPSLPSYPSSPSPPSTTPAPPSTTPAPPSTTPSPPPQPTDTQAPYIQSNPSDSYPGSPSWSAVYSHYPSSPTSFPTQYPSTPAPPPWSSGSPSFPSTPQPQLPSSPSQSFWPPPSGSVPSNQEGQQYILPYSSQLDSVRPGVGTPNVVAITPPSPLIKNGFVTTLPGTKSDIQDGVAVNEPGSSYAVSYYPNVFYISNEQFIQQPPSTGPSTNVQPTPPPPADISNAPSDVSNGPTDVPEATPPETPSTTSDDSSRSQPVIAEGSVRPVLTNIYTSNTIDHTRIPVLPQPYVSPYGYVYTVVPSTASRGYSPSLGFDYRGSFGFQGLGSTSFTANTYPTPLVWNYGRANQGLIPSSQTISPLRKPC